MKVQPIKITFTKEDSLAELKEFLINSKIYPEQDIILEFPEIQVIQHFKYGDGILYYHTFKTALKFAELNLKT